MIKKCHFGQLNSCCYHKGFYNDKDYEASLQTVKYSDFFINHEDDEFPYHTAWDLFSGSCYCFAVSLHKLLKYNVYIIEGSNKKSFHAFCQVYKNNKLYYVDARGMTTCFNEFLEGVKLFVNGELVIRKISDEYICNEKADEHDEEGLKFSEEVIKKYKDYYKFED